MSSIYQALKEIWEPRLREKTPEPIGTLTLNFTERTATFVPTEYTERYPEDLRFDYVHQETFSSALRAGYRQNEVSFPVTSIRTEKVKRLTARGDALRMVESQRQYGEFCRSPEEWDLHEEEMKQLKSILNRTDPDQPEYTVRHILEDASPAGSHRLRHLPNYPGIIGDLSMDAMISWKALELAHTAIGHARKNPGERKTIAGMLAPLRDELQATMLEAETTLAPDELDGDHAYQLALRTDAVLSYASPFFEWSVVVNEIMRHRNVSHICLLNLRRRLKLAELEGDEQGVERISLLLEDEEKNLEKIEEILRQRSFTTAIALA